MEEPLPADVGEQYKHVSSIPLIITHHSPRFCPYISLNLEEPYHSYTPPTMFLPTPLSESAGSAPFRLHSHIGTLSAHNTELYEEFTCGIGANLLCIRAGGRHVEPAAARVSVRRGEAGGGGAVTAACPPTVARLLGFPPTLLPSHVYGRQGLPALPSQPHSVLLTSEFVCRPLTLSLSMVRLRLWYYYVHLISSGGGWCRCQGW